MGRKEKILSNVASISIREKSAEIGDQTYAEMADLLVLKEKTESLREKHASNLDTLVTRFPDMPQYVLSRLTLVRQN